MWKAEVFLSLPSWLEQLPSVFMSGNIVFFWSLFQPNEARVNN